MTGEVFKEGSPENSRYSTLLDAVAAAGWVFGGGGTLSTGEVNMGFQLPRGHLDTQRDKEGEYDINDIKKGLGLVDTEGVLAEGYEVYYDPDADGTFVGYEGQFNEHYAITLELMADLANSTGGRNPFNEMRARVRRDPVAYEAYLAESARIEAAAEAREQSL